MIWQKVAYRLKINPETRLLILLGLVFMVHFPLLFNDFHTDDFLVLKIMRDGFDWQAFKHMENPFNFRPLTNLALLVRYHLLGGTAALWYLLNIGLHLLVTAFIHRLLRDHLDCNSAFFGALFFGIYFAHFEAVLWLYGIVRLLLALLVLIIWRTIVSGEKAPHGCRLYAPAVIYLAALLCVEDALLLLPFFVVLTAGSSIEAEKKVKMILGFAAAAAVYFAFRLTLTGQIPSQSELYYPGFHMLTNFFRYTGWLLLPQMDHPYFMPFVERYASFTIPFIKPLNIAVFAATLVAAVVIISRGNSFEKTALLFVFISLLPALPLASKVSSKLLYLPSIGVAILAGSLWRRCSHRLGGFGGKTITVIAALYFSLQALAINLTIVYYRSLQEASEIILEKIDDLKIDFNHYAYVLVDNAPGRSRPWTPFRLRYGYRGEVRARNESYEKQVDLDSLMVELEKRNISFIALDCRNETVKISRIFDPGNDARSGLPGDSP